jgi:hypothetical protein
MLTYNSILSFIVLEGLVKSYVIPRSIVNHKLDETGTFWLLVGILAVFSVLEFFILSNCINSHSMDSIVRDNSSGSILLLLVLSILVNYRWFITIYKKFNFWSTIGILSVVGFANEFNTIIIRSALQNIMGIECPRGSI